MIVLITGGIKSGKSDFALKKAQDCFNSDKMYFMATAYPVDDEMRERIKAHRNSRSEKWDTIEETEKLKEAFDSLSPESTVVVDCVTLWLANWLTKEDEAEYSDIQDSVADIVNVINNKKINALFVTNEVGLGIIPLEKISRRYQDYLGKLNKFIAGGADEVYLMVCGISRRIK